MDFQIRWRKGAKLPYVAEKVYIHRKHFAPSDLLKLQKYLTATYTERSSEGLVTAVRDLPLANVCEGFIGLPRNYGMRLLNDQGIPFIDRSIKKIIDPTAIIPDVIKPRDDQQAEFMNDIMDAWTVEGPTDNQVQARTGSGKTVSILNAIAKLWLGPTLVIVHTNTLKRQWLGSHEKKHGMRHFWGDEFIDDWVGVIQQEKCDFEGRLVCVAMLPSLAQRTYPVSFYKYFTNVVWDEVHVSPTPVLHKVFNLFPAKNRMGVSATPRKGEGAKIVNTQLGAPSIISEQKVVKPTVYRVIYDPEEPPKLNHHSRTSLMTSLALLPERQNLLTNIICKKVGKEGRTMVVLSDRIAQLQDLIDRCERKGLARERMGLYVGSYKTGQMTYLIKADRSYYRPEQPFDTYAKAKYRMDKRIRALVDEGKDIESYKVKPVEVKPSPEELDRIANVCDVMFCTYKIFATGNDNSDLDCGLEAMPIGDVEQALGRILRLKQGKTGALWYTIEDIIKKPGKFLQPDEIVKTFITMAKRRRGSYKRQDADIVRVRYK